MSQFWAIYTKVYFWTKNQQKWPKLAKTRIFLKMESVAVYTILMRSNLYKISKKSNEWILENIQKCWFLDQKSTKMAKIGKTRVYTPLCKISKKSNEPILSNIQKSLFSPTAPPTFAHFCPFWGQIVIFLEKWQHRLKRLIAF